MSDIVTERLVPPVMRIFARIPSSPSKVPPFFSKTNIFSLSPSPLRFDSYEAFLPSVDNDTFTFPAEIPSDSVPVIVNVAADIPDRSPFVNFTVYSAYSPLSGIYTVRISRAVVIISFAAFSGLYTLYQCVTLSPLYETVSVFVPVVDVSYPLTISGVI